MHVTAHNKVRPWHISACATTLDGSSLGAHHQKATKGRQQHAGWLWHNLGREDPGGAIGESKLIDEEAGVTERGSSAVLAARYIVGETNATHYTLIDTAPGSHVNDISGEHNLHEAAGRSGEEALSGCPPIRPAVNAT